MLINCDLDNPVNLGTEEVPDFEYSQINCTSTNETLELVENQATGTEFYLQKTISYGDVVLWVFLILFSIFWTIKSVAGFIIPTKIMSGKK
jgi:uncharacterized membrane protein